MTPARRAELQIRVVVSVYRAEAVRAREAGRRTDDANAQHAALRERCLAILDSVEVTLDGNEPWHSEMRTTLAAARAELGAKPAGVGGP